MMNYKSFYYPWIEFRTVVVITCRICRICRGTYNLRMSILTVRDEVLNKVKYK